MEKKTIRVNNAVLHWPALYSPQKSITRSFPCKYAVSFTLEEESERKKLFDEGFTGKIGETEQRFFRAQSGFPPLITPLGGQFRVLIESYQIAQARNMCPSGMFRGLEAKLKLESFEYERDGIRSKGLGLLEVVVDEMEVYKAAIAVEAGE